MEYSIQYCSTFGVEYVGMHLAFTLVGKIIMAAFT